MAFKDNLIKGLSSGLGSGITSSVFGALSSVLQNHFANQQADKMLEQQKEINQQTFEQNQALAHQQNQYNIEQWNRENQYNSPKAQMARFAAAGLNPDLIYNQSNTSASSPSLVAGTPQNPTSVAQIRQAALQQAAQLQNTFAQNRLLDAQARNLNADTKQKNANAEGLELENAFQFDTYEQRKDALFTQGSLLWEQLGLAQTERDTAKQLYRQVVYQTLNFADRYQAEMANLNEDALNKRYHRALSDKQFQLALEKFAEQLIQNEHTRNMDKAKLKQEAQKIAQGWTSLMFHQQLLPYQQEVLQSTAFGTRVNAVTNYLNGVIGRQVSAATLTGLNLQNDFNKQTFGVRFNLLKNQQTSGRLGIIQQGWNIATAPLQLNLQTLNQASQIFGNLF